MLPEIILFAEAENTFFCYAYFLIPYIKRLVVLQIYRRIKPVRIKAYHLCQKFPRPCDSLTLEIITEREIAKHFKERAVTSRLSDIFDITCSYTFLACRNSAARRYLCPRKIRLQRRHTRIYQKKAVIVLRYKRKAFHHKMTFFRKEIKKHFSQFINAVLFQFRFLPYVNLFSVLRRIKLFKNDSLKALLSFFKKYAVTL